MAGRGQGAAYQGMNWIRGPKRYAIYYRDRDPVTGNFRCLWCNQQVWPWLKGKGRRRRICLDHLIPWHAGGNNTPHNLVTSCDICNNVRGGQSWEDLIDSDSLDEATYQRIQERICRPLTDEEKQAGQKLWDTREKNKKTSTSMLPYWNENV